jgi:hypothetical protein
MILSVITLTALWLYLLARAVQWTRFYASESHYRQQLRRTKLTVMHWNNTPLSRD